ncbi:S66 peptidase family protein [Rickettsiales endosymbiont of Stachyamoeba lipophora]|uniref:S66 peptidase family protein n=1 Tax=Rickettsiales endosymbiont of Stachyamoeba lipophora TaxID=2486578 RepID=UPI000F652CE5|nr:LD-carboxypeptidase [Rickettsiales endosymbiont of Stachyamoeba lipophora]AZL14965.1 LD-carboxypeptidase [Rickettsiales endosymbiont of Stachyamoeba lipophora]
MIASKPGDIVDVIAPSGKFSIERIKPVKEFIESLGLIPRIHENIITDEHFYFANNDEFRANELIKALTNPDSSVVWCMRGGYGAARLIPYLEQVIPPEIQKIFIGFSDITAIHTFLNQQWGWQTIHGPVLLQMAENRVDEESKQEILDIIKGEIKQQTFNLLPLNKQAEEAKHISGKLCGGNATVIKSSIGTSWEIQTENKILLLEEIGEAAYSVDRSLTHLLQANIINNQTKALLIGDYLGNAAEQENINYVVNNFAHIAPCPVFRTHGIGHGEENHSIMLNAESEIIKNVDDFIFINNLDYIN